MKKATISILTILITFYHSLLAAQALPEFKARYAVQKFKLKVAEATYQLNHTDTGYEFLQNTSLHGIASVFDDGSVSAVSYVDEVGDNLLLTSHRYVLTGSKKNKNEDWSILWNTHKNMLDGKISGTVRGKKIDLKTDTEIWDVLSFQIPLMIEASSSVKEYPYKAILKGKINTYNFILTAVTDTRFSGKGYKAIELVRTDPRKDRKLHIWLIPDLHNIPVIVENYRDGSLHSRMQLEQVQFDDEAPITDLTTDKDDI